MPEEPPSVIDEPAGADATETGTTHTYNIAAYMRAGRTCTGVIGALGQALDTDPHELPPLYTAIKCDAVEQLFRPHPTNSTADVSLTFTYAGQTVTITADGRLSIQA